MQKAVERWGPDRSEQVYDLGDGWSIRRPGTAAEVSRAGWLLENCLDPGRDFKAGFHTWPPEFPGHAQVLAELHVLADPDRHPRLTFAHADGRTWALRGRRNQDPAPGLVERLRAWPDAGTIDLEPAEWQCDLRGLEAWQPRYVT